MFTINIDPVIFGIGHLMIRWYSLIVAVSIAVGMWITSREALRKGLNEKQFSDLLAWVIISGLIGARLFHVIDHWSDEYSTDPIRSLYIWEGGLAIWGAVSGGFAGLSLFAWRRKLSIGFLADMAAPGLVLAQGIGRLACIITGDAIGKITKGPFGFAYSNAGAMVPQLGVYYTPTPVYEIIMNVTIFAILWRLRKRYLPHGALFLIYLLLYSAGRFVITFWSSYKIVAFGLNQAQLVSLVVIILGLPWIIYLLSKNTISPEAMENL